MSQNRLPGAYRNFAREDSSPPARTQQCKAAYRNEQSMPSSVRLGMIGCSCGTAISPVSGSRPSLPARRPITHSTERTGVYVESPLGTTDVLRPMKLVHKQKDYSAS